MQRHFAKTGIDDAGIFRQGEIELRFLLLHRRRWAARPKAFEDVATLRDEKSPILEEAIDAIADR